MNINKSRDMTPFDMERKPSKQYPFLLPLIWGGSYLMTRQFGLRIEKHGMDRIKPPYLVIATHQGFSDYYIGPLATFPHRTMFVSDMEGFAAFGKWLYRGIGCIGKRRYVSDSSVVRNIRYGLSCGQVVVVYPESRHSNVGTTAYIPDNLGRLAKSMNVPVVMLAASGSYLANPFWDEEHTRKVPMKAVMTCIYDKQQLNLAGTDEIQQTIEKYLQYDEYDYQKSNNIIIDYSRRAEGLHKALYHCMNCGERYNMNSHGAVLECRACGTVWNMNTLGQLEQGSNIIHIPDWYEWEREQSMIYFTDREYDVRIEALPNEKGFVDLGKGRLILNNNEFILEMKDRILHFPHRIRESVQTEYNYRSKGMCVVLSTRDCCYYIYSEQDDFNPTELQFIGEELYKRTRS